MKTATTETDGREMPVSMTAYWRVVVMVFSTWVLRTVMMAMKNRAMLA
jgi:hypothetical protein